VRRQTLPVGERVPAQIRPHVGARAAGAVQHHHEWRTCRRRYRRCAGTTPSAVYAVRVETVIHAPLSDVAAYASDPSHAPEWYANISSVEWETPPPAQVGSRVAFVAHFLGRRIAYTYEIAELVPGERTVMRTAQGPFPMETIYTWEAVDGGTVMTLRNTGSPSGFGSLTAPLVGRAMRRATTKDLAALKAIMEGAGSRS
jgi:hypothetical protein